MTSDRQIASNRKNGRRSRGPRTAAGKASSSRNALRHGLAVSVLNESKLCAQVEALAHSIAGNGADNFRLNQARIVAEAQVDLARIQDAKVTLMNSHIAEMMPTKGAIPGFDATRNPQCGDSNLKPQSDDSSSETTFPQEFVMAPTIEGLRQLAGLERYEHRAISRRRRAMRAFLAYQRI
jgi:hypothetical protein